MEMVYEVSEGGTVVRRHRAKLVIDPSGEKQISWKHVHGPASPAWDVARLYVFERDWVFVAEAPRWRAFMVLDIYGLEYARGQLSRARFIEQCKALAE